MKSVKKNTLVRGGLILLIAFALFNVVNFFFHFAMARMLTVAEYGLVAALFSVIYVIGIFSESIQTVLAQYVAKEESKGKIKDALSRAMKKGFVFSTIFFVLYALLLYPLSLWLKIPISLLLFPGVLLIATFILPITRGALQGKQRFASLGSNLVIEALVKLVFAILFVATGYAAFGAMLGVIIGSYTALIFSLLPLRDFFSVPAKKAQTETAYSFTKPTFVIISTITVFLNLDIIIAKNAFSAETAGIYAIASVLAKTLFLGTKPISKALFPMSASNKEDKERKRLFKQSLGITIALLLGGIFIFYMLPSLVITLFSGKTIPQAAAALPILGLSACFISIANLRLLYKLSSGQLRNYWIMPLVLPIQAVALYLFTSSLTVYATAFLLTSVVLLLCTFLLTEKRLSHYI